MIHLDTNFLIQAMVSGSDCERKLLEWLGSNQELGISVIAWSEFLCGPLAQNDQQLASVLFAAPEPFLPVDAEKSAELFNATGRRSRTLADCQIAAIALRVNASIATSNQSDFKPFAPFGLTLA